MLLKLGIRDVKRMPFLNLLVFLLLAAAFLTAISIVSAIQVKFEKYSALSEYLEGKGVYIESVYLQKSQDGKETLLRDEAEVKEYLPDVKNVLSVEQVWDVSVTEREIPVTLWCYSGAVTDAVSPSLESGRWFEEADMESGMLKAVVTRNEAGLHTGDVVTLETGMSDARQQVEIIGVIEDGESLFFYDNLKESTGDYRDCYYTYDYEVEEGNVVMLLSDRQILNGKKRGDFGNFNYRLEKNGGFQKEMTGGTMLLYDKDTPQTVIDRDVEQLKQHSTVYRVYSLEEMKEKSWDYILQELHDYLPIFVCIFIFVLIAAVSANAVTAKKQLKNYAVYYTCGMPWNSCARISLCISCILSAAAFIAVVLSVSLLRGTGFLTDAALRIGLWQTVACGLIMLCYVLPAWLIPLGIVRNTSAKEIMADN